MLVSAALRLLPGSEWAIKELFEGLGIVGTSDDSDCPLFQYLKRSCPEEIVVGVSTWSAYTSVCGTEVRHDLPRSAVNFVETFDEGLYPSLIRRGECASI